jgi:hypothetical protein
MHKQHRHRMIRGTSVLRVVGLLLLAARNTALHASHIITHFAVSSDGHTTSASTASSISHGEGGVLEDVDSDDF